MNKTCITLIATLFVGNIILLVMYLSSKGEGAVQLRRLKNYDKIEAQYFDQIRSNKGEIPFDSILRDENGNTQNISYVVGKGSKLVLRFTQLNCESCIEESIEKLNQFSDKIGKQNILYLVTYSDIRMLKSIRENYKLKSPLLMIEDRYMSNIGFESLNLPYFFMLNETGRTSMTFVPDKLLPKTSEGYFNLILKKMSNN
jgi:peroxiredoxin